MEQLCPHLANGYLRYYPYAGIAAIWNDQPNAMRTAFGRDCPSAGTDDAFVEAMFGDGAEARANLCAVDGGYLTPTVAKIAQLEAAGRLSYDAEAAGRCMASGRSYFDSMGGLLAAAGEWTRWLPTANPDGGETSEYDPCTQVLTGRVALGQPCMEDVECAPGTTGSACVRRGSQPQGCSGVCVQLAAAGEECDSHESPGCQEGLVCLKPGDGRQGVCAPKASAGAVCKMDGGMVECPTGLACVGGVCAARSGENGPCEDDLGCQEGLFCVGNPGTCQPGVAEGQPCRSGYTREAPCQRCLYCTQIPENDGGVGVCRSMGQRGESCTNRECLVGLACVNGVCAPSARTGEACSMTDHTPASVVAMLQGSCLRATDACVGGYCITRATKDNECSIDPNLAGRLVQGSCESEHLCVVQEDGTHGHCVPEDAVGIPCTVESATEHAAMGSCTGDGQYCIRPSAQVTRGTCEAPPLVGEPCGDRFELAPSCKVTETNGSFIQDVHCSANGDGGVGVCHKYDGLEGDPCTMYSCKYPLYCAMVDGANHGTCQQAGALDDDCSTSAPWGTRCREGLYCRLNIDPWEYRCKAYEALGQPCTSWDSCGPALACINSICSEKSAVGGPCLVADDCVKPARCLEQLCHPLAALGEDCTYDSECQSGTRCDSNVCVDRPGKGERCVEWNECEEGLECMDGICRDRACSEELESSSCSDLSYVPSLLFFGAMVGWPLARRRRQRSVTR